MSFIEGAIPSVWALETLILMRREPRRPWSIDALVGDLRASTPLVEGILSSLQASGLVLEEGGRFSYAPASQTLDRLCENLEAAYQERPVTVVNAITARRTDPLKGFADSFRFRGWKP
jgi:hypothetical protein